MRTVDIGREGVEACGPDPPEENTADIGSYVGQCGWICVVGGKVVTVGSFL